MPPQNIFPDDVLVDDFATEEQKDQRLKELQSWITYFINEYNSKFKTTIKIDDKSISLINSTYWETLESQVRPRLKSPNNETVTIDRHKIASATELSICYVAPLELESPSENDRVNAELAYFIALNIIGNFNPDKMGTLFVSDSFNREHLTWLRSVRHSQDFQIFSNAATWYVVELICMERSDKSQNE